ncbi:6-phosphogluconolactonase [Chryseolinea lacunae]|uniref:Glucosamine-6-phosphate deaminase n=1 Tax=Chryseolinea lacunae TaxID=2801331 RepID=A0ABS1KYH0_9BACT|nr:glucosamine-6-phosphate deaminase [Chryseolinea lacunae]MBL0744495.1 glucosamine-6-phosphate deaminase [Chryseolinea lacunae]
MHVHLFSDYQRLSRATADVIRDYITKTPNALVCLASGHSPLGVFECLVKDIHAGQLDVSQCTFVGLDEWVGIAPNQNGSCREMMDKSFFEPAGISENQIAFFDALSPNLQTEADRINALIERRGGLDIMLVGVGTNGHIAMNEPGTPFTIAAHVSTLAEETKTVGQKYFEQSTILDKGITLGLKHVREAKLPILLANGRKKNDILKKAFTITPSPEIPASIFQTLAHGLVMLDVEAGEGLK